VSPRALGVIAVAGLAVVGFAIFYVASPRDGRSERASKPEKQAKAEPAEPLRKPIIKRPLKRPVEAEAPEETPELTLDDARKTFDDYIAELDREVARLEQTGGTLTQEDWVKYRTRAADAIDGVLRTLDHRDPNMIVEIKAKQEAVKSRLDKIKPPGAN
jgi:hypothetical protein